MIPWGRELARVTMERPDDVESTEKRSELVGFATQLSERAMTHKANE
jgi:hypothetical protein